MKTLIGKNELEDFIGNKRVMLVGEGETFKGLDNYAVIFMNEKEVFGSRDSAMRVLKFGPDEIIVDIDVVEGDEELEEFYKNVGHEVTYYKR